jgi:hypothetical protein
MTDETSIRVHKERVQRDEKIQPAWLAVNEMVPTTL